MSTRMDWDPYFLDITAAVAARSTCRRIPDGVGAILVRNNQILATGYAGSIAGTDHCTDAVGCLIDEKTGGCIRTVHAEMNSILQAARHGVSTEGATLYATMSPCWDCFKAAANGGIKRIVYSVEYRLVERQAAFAKKCGIGWEHAGTERYVPGQSFTVPK